MSVTPPLRTANQFHIFQNEQHQLPSLHTRFQNERENSEGTLQCVKSNKP
jgi:hypothetical protein